MDSKCVLCPVTEFPGTTGNRTIKFISLLLFLLYYGLILMYCGFNIIIGLIILQNPIKVL